MGVSAVASAILNETSVVDTIVLTEVKDFISAFSFCTKIIHTLIHIFYTKIIHISILGYKNFKLVEDSLILVIDGQQIIDIDMSDTKFNFFKKISNLIL